MHHQISTRWAITLLPALTYTSSPPCMIPPAHLTNFHWHNSTHNCGCDDRGCLPTGLHGGPGCGPPDEPQATLIEPSLRYNTNCYALDPGIVPAQVIPGGPYPCRSLGRRWYFAEDRETGMVTFIEPNVYWYVLPLCGGWPVVSDGQSE